MAENRRRPRRQIAVALAIVATGLVAITSSVLRSRAPTASPHAPILAVMPFASDAGAMTSATTGIAEVLSATLQSTPGLVVVPRSAVARYGATPAGLAAATKELGLEYAVTGAVQGNGNQWRIAMNVVDAPNGSIVASRVFQRDDTSAFPLLEQTGDWVVDQIARLSHYAIVRRSGPTTADPRAFEDYSQGREYLDRSDVPGNIARAIDAFQRAVDRDPKFALAHAALGSAYWSQYSDTRDPRAAVNAKEAALEALRLDPGQPMVRYALALVYQGTGRREDAIDELQKALALQPASDESHRLLGQIYGDIGETEKAIGELLVAIRLRPGFWSSYRVLGIIYYKAGRYRDAIATFTRLTELQPDSASGFQLLGSSYHLIGDLDRALVNYERANAIRPTPAAWSNIGTIYYHQKRFTDAASAYRTAIRLKPKEPSSYRNLGDTLLRAGDRPGAIAAYRQAIAISDDRLAVEKREPTLMAEKALCLAKTGAFAEARAIITDARAISASAGVLYQEAIIDTLEGRMQDALKTLRLAVEAGYSRDYARQDDEFEPLRAFPEFGQIVSPR